MGEYCRDCRGSGWVDCDAHGADPNTGRPIGYDLVVRCECRNGEGLKAATLSEATAAYAARGLRITRRGRSGAPLTAEQQARAEKRFAGWRGRAESPQRAAARERTLALAGEDSRRQVFEGRGAGDDYDDDAWRA